MSGVRPFSVCVYCGSRHGVRPEYTTAARAMGQAIGERGWRLVYGGGNVGLMGEVADATLAAGGTVLGVIPERLLQREVGHHGLTELVVVQNMHQRKMRMAEEADAFVALPGGIGTFEELFEMWSWRHLGYHDKPLGLLEVQGFWAPMVGFLRSSVAAGFMDDSQMAMLALDSTPARLLDSLAASPRRQAADYRGA
ncbi:TIGR00730 family Rossman fold protein [Ideonella sp. 4Y16]|uniref:Cytokinin riboside 5'-monophosphate phosphoribohydrolase n=1 Tax=Ideonella alba TaxID=2824118 RepID=A0A940YC73_9BURK|nr:TIGR00730 family Rossman fold protein [Ideonella alba]MBQ0931975.1 TIGR00730 family Rossman fold protein [Ideonella alba]MBQ0942516.1 TIGR00730 family Rossman fold protein [Ideonella alba]